MQKHNTTYVGHHYAHTHTHTINVNKTCALQQTTGKTGTKHSRCEIDVNITHGGIFFTHHEQYYIDINIGILIPSTTKYINMCSILFIVPFYLII